MIGSIFQIVISLGFAVYCVYGTSLLLRYKKINPLYAEEKYATVQGTIYCKQGITHPFTKEAVAYYEIITNIMKGPTVYVNNKNSSRRTKNRLNIVEQAPFEIIQGSASAQVDTTSAVFKLSPHSRWRASDQYIQSMTNDLARKSAQWSLRLESTNSNIIPDDCPLLPQFQGTSVVEASLKDGEEVFIQGEISDSTGRRTIKAHLISRSNPLESKKIKLIVIAVVGITAMIFLIAGINSLVS